MKIIITFLGIFLLHGYSMLCAQSTILTEKLTSYLKPYVVNNFSIKWKQPNSAERSKISDTARSYSFRKLTSFDTHPIKVLLHYSTNNNESFDTNLCFYLEQYDSVLVATKAIPVGTEISSQNTNFIYMNTATLKHYVSPKNNKPGQISKVTIPYQKPIHTYQVRDPYAIKKGDSVIFQTQEGNVIAMRECVAQQNGNLNDIIRIYDKQHRYKTRARIIGKKLCAPLN